jgi:ABC-type proline/glycine betaine transport system permease subunit
MKEEAQPLPSGRWSWIAIAIFLTACVAGPVVTVWQQASSGEEHMAAAYTGLIAAAAVLALGLPVAIVAFVKEKDRRLLCRISSTLYAVPLLGAFFLLIAYLANA